MGTPSSSPTAASRHPPEIVAGANVGTPMKDANARDMAAGRKPAGLSDRRCSTA
jgi:hypothetical protein